MIDSFLATSKPSISQLGSASQNPFSFAIYRASENGIPFYKSVKMKLEVPFKIPLNDYNPNVDCKRAIKGEPDITEDSNRNLMLLILLRFCNSTKWSQTIAFDAEMK